jgi:VanZ family protein
MDSLLLRPSVRMRVLALLMCLLVAANLFAHGAQPYSVGVFTAPWDKAVHAVLFAAFATLIWVVLGGRRPFADVVAPLVAIGIGVADEWAQSFVPGRSVDAADLAADAFGALAAIGVLTMLRRRAGLRAGRGASLRPG